MRNALIAILKGYKYFLSPFLPAACRFTPTCSEYAQEAIQRHGVMLGGWLALCRLLRCHPMSEPRHDPVPEK